MQAYDNPAFVEDIARDVGVALRDDARVARFAVRVTNQESIHNHNAVARLRWERAREPPDAISCSPRAPASKARRRRRSTQRTSRAAAATSSASPRDLAQRCAGRGPLPRPAAPAADARRRRARATPAPRRRPADRVRRLRPRRAATTRSRRTSAPSRDAPRRAPRAGRDAARHPATRCDALLAQPTRPRVVLLGEDYLDACELDDDTRRSAAPTLVFCGARTALRCRRSPASAVRSRSATRRHAALLAAASSGSRAKSAGGCSPTSPRAGPSTRRPRRDRRSSTTSRPSRPLRRAVAASAAV